MQIIFSCLFFIFCIIQSPLYAATYVLSPSTDIVGQIEYTSPQIGETLSDVGIRYDVGYYEMLHANPHADPTRPLSPQTKLIIPSQYILPSAPREGILINLAEFRLYYFPPGDNVVVTFPVGIGREGWNTPIGLTKVINKERDPIWRPTANVRAEAAKNGTPIPDEFPPGIGNPLGRHVMRLGWPTYLIHGTNRRDGVGSRVSAGCIRMMPEDIEVLFDMVAVGAPVRVINEPVKMGKSNKNIYIEVHRPLEQHQSIKKLCQAQLISSNFSQITSSKIHEECNNPTGIPKKISS